MDYKKMSELLTTRNNQLQERVEHLERLLSNATANLDAVPNPYRLAAKVRIFLRRFFPAIKTKGTPNMGEVDYQEFCKWREQTIREKNKRGAGIQLIKREAV